MFKRSTTAAAVVVAMLAGCSGGDGGEGRAQTVETTTTDRQTTTTGRPASPMSEVVIQLSDLPTGWTTAPPQEEDDEGFCEGHDPFNEVPPTEEAEASFQQSDFGPFVYADAARFESGRSEELLDAVAEMINACQSFTQTDDEGTESEWTLTPLSFPNLGDQTVAFRMTGTGGGFTFVADGAVTRVGDVAVAVIHAGLNSVDSALTEQLLRAPVGRV